MINEVDESLRALLRTEVLEGTDVDVQLEAPTREWAGRHTAPTVDLYLYDIREDLTRREGGQVPQYNEDGHVTGHLPPPRTYRLAYLVTAWTQRPEDEHRLLSALLGCFLEHDFVPPQHLTDLLRSREATLKVQVGSPPPQDRQVSDVWTALGGNLKPSLDLVISLKMDAGMFQAAGPLVKEPMFLRSSAITTMEAEDDPKQGRHLAAVEDAASEDTESQPSPAETKTARRKSTRRRSGGES